MIASSKPVKNEELDAFSSINGSFNSFKHCLHLSYYYSLLFLCVVKYIFNCFFLFCV